MEHTGTGICCYLLVCLAAALAARHFGQVHVSAQCSTDAERECCRLRIFLTPDLTDAPPGVTITRQQVDEAAQPRNSCLQPAR